MKILVVPLDEFASWRMLCLENGVGVSADEIRAGMLHGSDCRPMFAWTGEPITTGFVWECPGCGTATRCTLGDVPRPGLDEPRWVNVGSLAVPSLLPSLTCAGWTSGDCTRGRWWIDAGSLLEA